MPEAHYKKDYPATAGSASDSDSYISSPNTADITPAPHWLAARRSSTNSDTLEGANEGDLSSDYHRARSSNHGNHFTKSRSSQKQYKNVSNFSQMRDPRVSQSNSESRNIFNVCHDMSGGDRKYHPPSSAANMAASLNLGRANDHLGNSNIKRAIDTVLKDSELLKHVSQIQETFKQTGFSLHSNTSSISANLSNAGGSKVTSDPNPLPHLQSSSSSLLSPSAAAASDHWSNTSPNSKVNLNQAIHSVLQNPGLLKQVIIQVNS